MLQQESGTCDSLAINAESARGAEGVVAGLPAGGGAPGRVDGNPETGLGPFGGGVDRWQVRGTDDQHVDVRRGRSVHPDVAGGP